MQPPETRESPARRPARPGEAGPGPRNPEERGGRGRRRRRADGDPAAGPAPGVRGWRQWGSLPAAAGVLMVAAGAVAGTAATVLSGRQPGLLLGACVLAATVCAGLGVHPRAAYLIVPAPALGYGIAAIAAGLIQTPVAASSTALLAVTAAQWLASGFLAVAAATVVAAAIAAARWLRDRRRPAGSALP